MEGNSLNYTQSSASHFTAHRNVSGLLSQFSGGWSFNTLLLLKVSVLRASTLWHHPQDKLRNFSPTVDKDVTVVAKAKC